MEIFQCFCRHTEVKLQYELEFYVLFQALGQPNSPSQGFNAGNFYSQGKNKTLCRLFYTSAYGFSRSMSVKFQEKN